MKTADELLTQVNAFLDALPYERTPKSQIGRAHV